MEEQTIQTTEKKSKAWLWILIIIVLIVIGVIIYFVLSSGDAGSILGGGSSIPQPPALPS
jgi:flagellar basal body-associated protein FliL